jgi:hypothetical protein
MARRLAREEGVLVGTSSGLNIAAAVQLARELGPGKVVATVAVDSGLSISPAICSSPTGTDDVASRPTNPTVTKVTLFGTDSGHAQAGGARPGRGTMRSA